MSVPRALTLDEALRYGTGIERPFLCPVHGDSNPSASVNTIKGVWFCYACGARGKVDGEARLAEPDYEMLKLWVEATLAPVKTYPETWLSRYDAGPVHPYWQQRVGEPAARRFRLGYDPLADAVTYPLRDQVGGVLGVVRRTLGGFGPKYKYPSGADVGRLLFNYTPEQRKAVVLCEGALDAIALWNVGIDAFAIYGSNLSEHQTKLVRSVDPTFIYCCYDLDKAGYQAAWATEHVFKECFVDRLEWPRAWGKDIDEIGEEHRKYVVRDLVSEGHACIG